MKASMKVTDLDDAMQALNQLGPARSGRALAQALNETVKVAEQELRGQAQSVFDRPTPFTLNAFRITYAKPSNPEAAVWVKDEKSGSSGGQAPEDWFAPQVYGGPREVKASERWLRQAGILPGGKFIAPGKGARLDAYGNISRGHMMQILSGLRAMDRAGSDHNATGSRQSSKKGHGQAFFVLSRGDAPIGIGERRGSSMQVVLLFVSEPDYAARFDFHGTVRKVIENDALVESAIDRAIADALG
ncbi:hypothetical protein HG264_04275 [Pseudomonas sp. gcc21]|uniref:hypothetical protein n=1 Tax=Pseudomonas sp. gcc21 TaxID=2726989 RepID=UPI001451A8EA|nr:hypothetical protein [Pseudomonas sp. gcc21]QJD58188.1 hypothetical protein HG264_04275 [Pseudomonas sp. gcc21]